jgi:hypothetical protein
MNTIYGIEKKETKKVPIMAGMPFLNPTDMKIRKVGYKLIEFTYDVNPDYPDDKMLIRQREIKRKIYQ